MPDASRDSLFGSDVNTDVTRGLTIDRVFSSEGEDPFDSVTWGRRDAAIKNHTGEKIFEQTDV